MANEPMYLDDVVEKTDISERNVKYWSQKYDLPVEKDGRRNVYPKRTIQVLRMIRALSESELFTHHFIRIQVQRALGTDSSEIDRSDDYQDVRKTVRSILKSIDGSLGSAVLPALGASGRRRQSRARTRSGDDLDEGVL